MKVSHRIISPKLAMLVTAVLLLGSWSTTRLAAQTPLQISQQAYVKASNTGEGDYFGASVAVSGDTMVIGAGGESSNATGVNGNQATNSALGSGAAYVFVRNGTNWIQQAYLKASNTGAHDGFGGDAGPYGVAISGDTIVVGAPGEASNATGVNGNQADNSAFGAGAVYVFARSETNWTQQTYVKASSTGEQDRFGGGPTTMAWLFLETPWS